MSFTLIEERQVHEIDSIARLYTHNETGARILSIENKDENKSFGISFRTPPVRSDGIAHILEHSVLCGSKKYPVKEPFVELIKGSLNTFLNAFTYPDKTVYPVASTNLKDFYTLVDVYLDAVFNPLLTEDTFRQEGWHYEVNPETGALEYKGVVFNEMKGAYSDPDDLHDDLCRRSLYPDTAYGLDSGGDPAIIPSLDYPTFVDFHSRYYHPSNSFIYFYGDDDPAQRLAILDGWLHGYTRMEVDSLPGIQDAFDEPRKVMATYEGKEPKAWVAVNWALPRHGDPETSLSLSILSHILIGTPSSPLHVALIESGLGEDLAGFGLEDGLRQTAWSIGLKAVDPDETNEVEALVLETLEALASKGIDPKTIAASMNTIEFALREKNTGRFPRGLAVMLEALGEWLYGENPLNSLAFEGPLRAIKEGIAKGGYFEKLIRRWFLDNTHRTVVHLLPDSTAEAARIAAEREALDSAKAGMSESDIRNIAEIAAKLKVLQGTPDSPEALATIPSLHLSDLPLESAVIPVEFMQIGDSTILLHDLSTSAILYADLAFPMDWLEDRLVPYAGLLGRMLLDMGTSSMDYIELGQEIGIHTGGISTSTLSASKWKNPGLATYFIVRSKTIADKADTLLDLLRTIILDTKLDNKERFRQIVLEEKAQAEASLIPSGHRLVSLRLRSAYTAADALSERIGGLEHLFFLRSLADRIETEWPAVLAELDATRKAILNASGAIFNITIDKNSYTQIYASLSKFLSELPKGERGQTFVRLPRKAGKLEFLTAPTQVNFVGSAYPLEPAGARAGAFLVVKKFLDTSFLWEKVRVQGGAYGGFSTYEINSGLFTFLSYRDPNLEKTIDIFAKAGEYLAGLKISEEEIRRSIIGTIGDVDAYLLPDAKGFTSLVHYLTGYRQQDRQAMREQILSAQASDFTSLAESLERSARNSLSAALTSDTEADSLQTLRTEGSVRIKAL